MSADLTLQLSSPQESPMKPWSAFASIAMLLTELICPRSACAATKYSLMDLGMGSAFGISANGQVTGHSRSTSSAFVFSAGTTVDIGGQNGFGINNFGQVTGTLSFGNGYQAFSYSNGVMTNIGALGGRLSAGRAINNQGQITGEAELPGVISYPPTHAFLYSAGVMSDLGTLGGTNSYAWGINDSGEVVGHSFVADDRPQHGFIYSGGLMRDIGTLGGSASFAMGISSSGLVTGSSDVTGDGAVHAFLYGKGAMQDLGTLGGSSSNGLGVNSAGQVVGTAQLAGSPAPRAFIYSGGSMADLNSLLDDMSGPDWTLTYALAINDAGQIVANASLAGSYFEHAVLLTPVPELSTYSLMSAGCFAGSIFIRRKKRKLAVVA